MKVEFYFDPSCPFSWITSRWLLMVSSDRDITITWRPFSLALKNDELERGDGKYAKQHRASHRVLRVMQAAYEQHQAELIKLYTTAGISFHVVGADFDDKLIIDMLRQNNVPDKLLKSADDTTYDAALQKSIKSATDVVGQDVGVPIIIFVLKDGSKQGYFGPVLQELPDRDEALELWDGLSKLATSKGFYELKRTRPSGDPDVYSTAKC